MFICLLIADARVRLSGALTSAVENNSPLKSASTSEFGLMDDDDLELDLAADLDTPLKRIINSTSPWSSPVKSPSSRSRRSRRTTRGGGQSVSEGKSDSADSAFHHTFVMKLFDRSVDLAQFGASSSSALYPVCRAWMKNQPTNTTFAPRPRSKTPEPKDEDDEEQEEEEEEVEKSDDDKTEEDEEAENDEDKEPPMKKSKKEKKKKGVYKLPDCEALCVLDDGVEDRIRIPKRPRKEVDDFTLESINDASKNPQELISSHMKNWTEVRDAWKKSYADNEARYANSMNVLREIFEK